MAEAGCDCSATNACHGSSPPREELRRPRNIAQQTPPPLSRLYSNFSCASTCGPPQSITTSSSSTAIDASSQLIALLPHSPLNPPCLDSDTESVHNPTPPRKISRARALLTCCHPSQKPSCGCCTSESPPRLRSMAPHHHNGSDQHYGVGRHQHHDHAGNSEGSSTYCSSSHVQDEATAKEYANVQAGRDDGERGSGSMERVVLTVSGLKCGCCETGIAAALRNIPGISNAQVNIVLAKIEFELDTSQFSVFEVIAQLHRATGYTFKQYEQPEGQVLELIVRDPAEIYRAPKPYGVTLVDQKDKTGWRQGILFSGRSSPSPAALVNTMLSTNHPKDEDKRASASLSTCRVRVHYDAKQIGARDVFEYYQQLSPEQNIQLAPAASHPSVAVGAKLTTHALYKFLLTLAFTIPILVFAWGPVDHDNLAYAHTSLVLATIVQIVGVREFVPGAFQALVHSGRVEMDFLVAMSTTTAYIFSIVSYVFQVRKRPLETGSFFETSTLLVTLILLGRAVNEFARFKAAMATSIRSLQTNEAVLVTSHGVTGTGTASHKIDARLLQYGDRFMVLPHSRIVTDGKVICGGSEVDESMITGESVPVAKGLGHEVHAGTMNGSGQLEIELVKLPHENSISEIAAMVENAELSKPKIQALADKIAGMFVPVIGTIGLLVFLIWLLTGHYLQRRSWGSAVVQALTYSIATIVVSCPCAIGLAVPMVVLIAGGTSARFGIIFRDSQKLEVARNITDVVFDKTGTITTGELTVVNGHFYGSPHDQTERMIIGLLEGNKHPVAAAVVKWVQAERKRQNRENIDPIRMMEVESVPGNGVKGICEESRIEVRAGNPEWLGVSVLESQHTLLCVTVSGILSATFRLEDAARVGADRVVALLKKRSLQVHMISGDGEGAVNQIAHTLGISKSQTRWRQKPLDKQRYVHELQKEGKVVLFCGDGTNDSAALKQADVGVHMNQGSDVAKSASDVVLMAAHLHDLLIMLDISKAAYRRIIGNFSWCFIYNVLAILLASGAMRKVRLEPAYAGLGELASVLPVVLIAFQMKWRDYGKQYKGIEYES